MSRPHGPTPTLDGTGLAFSTAPPRQGVDVAHTPSERPALDRNLGWLDEILTERRRRQLEAIARLPPLLPDSPMDRMLRHLATQEA